MIVVADPPGVGPGVYVKNTRWRQIIRYRYNIIILAPKSARRRLFYRYVAGGVRDRNHTGRA